MFLKHNIFQNILWYLFTSIHQSPKLIIDSQNLPEKKPQFCDIKQCDVKHILIHPGLTVVGITYLPNVNSNCHLPIQKILVQHSWASHVDHSRGFQWLQKTPPNGLTFISLYHFLTNSTCLKFQHVQTKKIKHTSARGLKYLWATTKRF